MVFAQSHEKSIAIPHPLDYNDPLWHRHCMSHSAPFPLSQEYP